LKKYAKTGTAVKIGRTGFEPATREPPNNFKVSKAGLRFSTSSLNMKEPDNIL
jgi:hypothetical protein